MKRIPRRIFTEEFKKEAVRLVQPEGLTMAEAARKLDVAPKSLKTWIDLHLQGALTGSPGVAKLSAEQLRIRELERKLAIAHEERDILKKPPRTLRSCRSKVRNNFKLKAQHSIPHLCQMLNVARSGYQIWLSGTTHSPRKQEDGRFTSLIRIAHARGRGTYGALKMQTALRDATGAEVASIVSSADAKPQAFAACIGASLESPPTPNTLPIAANLFNREFNQTSAPNQVWVTDITYITTNEGWLYLAAVKDLQASYKMKASMSREGDCWELALSRHLGKAQSSHNAPMESFLGRLKNEYLHHHKFKTRAEARKVAVEYIGVFYNRIRRHAKLKNQIPAEFAKACMDKLEQNAT